jgi:hypothetical protein
MNFFRIHWYQFHGTSKKFTVAVSRNKEAEVHVVVNPTFILQKCVEAWGIPTQRSRVSLQKQGPISFALALVPEIKPSPVDAGI